MAEQSGHVAGRTANDEPVAGRQLSVARHVEQNRSPPAAARSARGNTRPRSAASATERPARGEPGVTVNVATCGAVGEREGAEYVAREGRSAISGAPKAETLNANVLCIARPSAATGFG